MPNPEGYVVAATGHVYLAPVDTPAPTPTNVALSAPTTPWAEAFYSGSGENGGDNLPEWGSDGGDLTVLGSWGNHAIRTIQDPLTETLTINVSEVNRDALQLYTGADGGDVAGVFSVKGSEVGKAVEKAVLIVIHDGDVRLGFYAPRVSVTRGDSISVASDDGLVFPLSLTLLDSTTIEDRYQWISEDLFPLESGA
ncbi:hypothetical protein FPZ12_029580 [Amycolatopsis acidicola]|uniref:Phage tail protein n=1 Tax=Amycolatopsis acidicola TaxID=2596893 RepID=A0A5N0UTK1_9PSEU|nr:hypothetical protein [Amycolatopsis acidicola]KAA9155549.1 hypothetical protein FPZ12_029580 [Amycolatopsis acidicola]